jgi:hypothetical protein
MLQKSDKETQFNKGNRLTEDMEKYLRHSCKLRDVLRASIIFLSVQESAGIVHQHKPPLIPSQSIHFIIHVIIPAFEVTEPKKLR